MKGITRILFCGGCLVAGTPVAWAAEVEVVQPITIEHNGVTVEVVEEAETTPPVPELDHSSQPTPEAEPVPADPADTIEYVEFEEKEQLAAAPVNVWWGNRAVSFRNYIPIEVAVAAAYVPNAAKQMRWDNIFFDLKKSYLPTEVTAELQEVRMWLQASPGASIVIEAHACGDSADMALQRAEVVKRWLVENGVSPARMRTTFVEDQAAAPASQWARKWCPIVILGTAP